MNENDIGEGFWVFVSHSTKDFEKVRLVRNALEDSGFRPILFYLKCMEDEGEINELLKREIDARRRFILCDSPNAQASRFVQSEVEYIQSQKRMYEIIDLSQIDLNNPEAEKDVLNLIKPFKRRASVFINYDYYKDYTFAKQLEFECKKNGFQAWDMDFYVNQTSGSGLELNNWEFLTKQSIKATLYSGYYIGIISRDLSTKTMKETEYAYELDSSRVLPIIIDKMDMEQIPESLQKMIILNVSNIVSTEGKARAIVEALIAFDLKNQYTK